MKISWKNWDEIPKGKLKYFAELFAKNESSQLIKNVTTELRILQISPDIYFPVTINDTEWESSFVCSPYNAYALYSKDELLMEVKNKFIQYPLLFIIHLLSKWLKFGQINKNVHINNFLLSTNPYPEWSGLEIKEITKFIQLQYPDHSIIFRSLNNNQHQHLLKIFEAEDYKLIGSRQVYMFDLSYEKWLKKRNNRLDNKLIARKNLIFVDHAAMGEFIEQALNLYQKLYLKKYSKYNPQFTLAYFKTVYQQNIMLFQGYKDHNNVLKCFSGLFIIGDTITSPLVGYDTDMPQSEGLYIHAAQLAVIHKFKTGLRLNLSSGAPKFKRMRGGEPSIEYSAIYLNHLKWKRRIVWKSLQYVSNKIGVPLIEKYKL